MKYLILFFTLCSLYAEAQQKFALEIAGNYGKAFPYLNNANPNNATTQKSSVTAFRIDAVFRNPNPKGILQGTAGLRFGGFQFEVSPATRITGMPSYDTTHVFVSRGRACVMGGGLLTLPLNEELSFRASAQAGFGIAMGGIFESTTVVVNTEVYAGFALYNIFTMGVRHIFIPGNFHGTTYYNHRNLSITPDYGIHGIMIEAGIRLTKRNKQPRPEKERIIRYRD